MILREVFAWLRYCLQHDALCVSNGILVEEIPSTQLGLSDTQDGPRTLGIYCIGKGYTPRIEIRFLGERPQVWFVSKNDRSEYLSTPTSSKFPGDFRFWTRTEFVQYLIDLAKAKLCSDIHSLITIIPSNESNAATKVEANPKVDFETVMRVINAVKRSQQKPDSKIDSKSVTDFLRNRAGIKSSDPLMDFAHSVIYFFDKKKLKWEDIDLLEDEDGKGKDIIPWNFFKAQLSDPKRMEHLPTPIIDRLEAQASLEPLIRKAVEARNAGDDVSEAVNPLIDRVVLAQDFETAFKSGKLNISYLDLLQKVDRREKIAPWSWIRRSVLAFEFPTPVQASVEEAVLGWLEATNLYQALYAPVAESAPEEQTLKEIVRKRLSAYVKDTVGNPLWVQKAFDEVVGQQDLDRKTALQCEFDMWMLQALSPAMSGTKLPLSPHAFAMAKSEEKLYEACFAAWLGEAKLAKERRREVSLQAIGVALSSFYKELSSWQPDSLADYLPRTPSFREIKSAALQSDKDHLLNLLLADVEDELGVTVPAEVRAQLRNGPYIKQLLMEMRFQSIEL